MSNFMILFLVALLSATAGTSVAAPRYDTKMCVDRLVARAVKQDAVFQAAHDVAKTARRNKTLQVREQLALMHRADQAARSTLLLASRRCAVQFASPLLSKAITLMATVDQRNLAALKALLLTVQWPVISKYGRHADQTAFLIVQHADDDPSFQRQTLVLLESLVVTKETSAENYALLFDRVALSDKKPQRYGSQGECEAGDWKPSEIEDIANVDFRRAALGLGKLSSYVVQAKRLLCASE